ARSWRSRYAATSSATACRISAAIGPPWRSRAPPLGTRVSLSRPERLPGLASPEGLVSRRGELLDVVDDPLHADRHLGRVRVVPDRRQVHEDVRGGSVGGGL